MTGERSDSDVQNLKSLGDAQKSEHEERSEEECQRGLSNRGENDHVKEGNSKEREDEDEGHKSGEQAASPKVVWQ